MACASLGEEDQTEGTEDDSEELSGANGTFCNDSSLYQQAKQTDTHCTGPAFAMLLNVPKGATFVGVGQQVSQTCKTTSTNPTTHRTNTTTKISKYQQGTATYKDANGRTIRVSGYAYAGSQLTVSGPSADVHTGQSGDYNTTCPK